VKVACSGFNVQGYPAQGSPPDSNAGLFSCNDSGVTVINF
jgi:hypothetical protein